MKSSIKAKYVERSGTRIGAMKPAVGGSMMWAASKTNF